MADARTLLNDKEELEEQLTEVKRAVKMCQTNILRSQKKIEQLNRAIRRESAKLERKKSLKRQIKDALNANRASLNQLGF